MKPRITIERVSGHWCFLAPYRDSRLNLGAVWQITVAEAIRRLFDALHEDMWTAVLVEP